MKKLEANLELQILALEHIEKVYGKDWREKTTLNTASIVNAFIDGYNAKKGEDKTASKIIYSRKLVDKLEPQRETIEKFLGLEVIVKDDIPNNLIALVDDKGNVLSFIEVKEE